MGDWTYPMWIMRMRDELSELQNRIKRLKDFKDGEQFKTLDTVDKELMNRQLAYMEGYEYNLRGRVQRSIDRVDRARSKA